MHRLVACFAVALVASGCNCGGPSTPKDLYYGLVDALCGWEAKCGSIGKSEESSCKSNGDEYVDKYLFANSSYDIDAAIKAGRISIDSSNANKCLDSYRNLSCTGFVSSTQASACRDVYQGHVKAGDACQNTIECATGFCQASASGSCAGTCVAYAAAGAACPNFDECDPKVDYCSTPTGTTTATCQARGAAGATCASFSSTQCQDGLSCVNQVCAAAGQVGTACTYGGCADGLYCPYVVSGGAVCTARVGAGQACSDPQACPDGQVCAGFGSTAMAGKCTNVLDVSAVCDPNASACPTDAPCDTGTKKCTLRSTGTVGAACSATSTCSTGDLLTPPLYCDPATGKCAEKKVPGDPCTVPDAGTADGCTTHCDPATGKCAAPTSSCP
jgi:hypothetical protein